MSCRLILGAIGVALLASCGTFSDEGPTAAEESAYASAAPPLGETVDYFLYTHCGVESLHVDGRWWHAIQPLYGDNGPGSSPAGWDNPYQKGELTVNSERSITFEAEGVRVQFSPAPTNEPMRVCL